MQMELTEKTNNLIKHFLKFDQKQNPYAQVTVIVEQEQYFVEKMTKPALIESKSYSICSAHKVMSEEVNFIIVDSTDESSLKAVYRFNQNGAYKLAEKREEKLVELAELEDFINLIEESLNNQAISFLEKYPERITLKLRKELEDMEKISLFIQTFLQSNQINFKLSGMNLIEPLVGVSIPDLLKQYIEKAKNILQTDELLNLAIPYFRIEYGSELLSQFEKLTPTAQGSIQNLLEIDEYLYVDLFNKLKHEAVFLKQS